MNKNIISGIISLLIFSAVVAAIFHSNRYEEYSVKAKVISKTAISESRNPFKISEYKYYVDFSVVLSDPNIKPFSANCEDVDNIYYDKLQVDKWYRIIIRYYPGWRILNPNFSKYELDFVFPTTEDPPQIEQK